MFWILGLGFRGWISGFGFRGLGFKVFRVFGCWVSGFRILGLEFRGLGFKVFRDFGFQA